MAPTKAGFEFDSESYHRGSATHRFEYDPASTPPSMAVVSALGEVLDVGPTELEPIAKTVDTDAVDALVRDFDAVGGDADVSWIQAGFTVTVASDGVVTMSPAVPDQPESAVEQ
jgi:hypothetical protein